MKEKWNQYRNMYHLLEPDIQSHYNLKLFIALLLFLVPLLMLFVLKYPKGALFVLALVLGNLFYIIHTIYLFCSGKVFKISGVCEEVTPQRFQKNFHIIRFNIYGKCTMNVRVDDIIYTMQVPHNNAYTPGSIVNIWYDGNSYKKKGNLHVIPCPYIITLFQSSNHYL